MLAQKQAEEAIVSNFSEAHDHEGKEDHHQDKEEENTSLFNVKNFLWHGGSVWDAWFSCASNQVHPPTQYKRDSKFCFFLTRLTKLLIPFDFCFPFAGSSSAFDTAILILSAGIIIRHLAANILWNRWKLDCLPDQCALHRVQKQEGERER